MLLTLLRVPVLVLAIQPVGASPSTETMATQPVEDPDAGPEVLLSGTGSCVQLDQSPGGKSADITGRSESEADLDIERDSSADDNFQGELPDDIADNVLSEEATYRETIRRVRTSWAGTRSLTLTVLHLP